MKWLKDNLTIKRELFRLYAADIALANRRTMFLISAIGTCICVVLVFLSLPFIGEESLLNSYTALALAFFLFTYLSQTLLKEREKLVLPMFYALMIMLDFIAIYMGTVQGQDTNATTYLIFMLLVPLFMIDYPWRLSLINGMIAAFFIWIDCRVKAPGPLLFVDISNTIVVFVICIVFIKLTVRRNLNAYEMKHKEAEELNRKNDLINALPVGVAAFEVHGSKTTQVFTNDEFYRLFEDTREERAKRTEGNFMNSIHPDDRKKLGQLILSVIHGKDYVTMPCRSVKGDGSYMWVRFSSSVAKRDGDDLLVYSTYSSMEDEMKSKEATQAKTDFLSRMSHDMRTPLNGMLGLASLMKDSIKDDAVLRDLAQLEISGQYLLNLINDTLDVSRIESGRLELHPSVCYGMDIFQNVRSLTQPTLDAKHIELIVNTSGLTYPLLYIDIGRVEQIMLNIFGNAAKFTAVGGTIECTMKNISNENGIITDEVSIRDNGIGISKEFLPYIFEPFSQEDSSKKNARQGTGLGMIITKQLVELMGGHIWVESEIGKGTTVTFTLVMPIATEKQVAEYKTSKKQSIDDEILSGKRILLCEDHPLNAQIATRLLEKKHISVEHAENGQLGCEMFERSELGYYDLILMDIRMPVMDGLEATGVIRRLDRADAKSIPIIAMTANAFDEDVKQAREAGMNAHLGKPIETEKMYQTLEQMMRKKLTYDSL